MANKKRYWLKVKENFFDDDEIVFLKSQENGYQYIYLWQRLLLKCLRSDEEKQCGFLRINDKVPYDVNILSELFGINVDVVRVGIEVFQRIGMLEILEDGTYYIEAVQKMIGKESESAERVRLHREKKNLLQCNNNVTIKLDNIIQEEEIKKEKKKEKKIEDTPPTFEEFERYIKDKKLNLNANKLYEYYQEGNWHDGKGNKVKNWKQKLLVLNNYQKNNEPETFVGAIPKRT